MEKLQSVVEMVGGAKYKTTNDKINQVQARKLKSAINKAIENVFNDLGLETGEVSKGFIVRLPNETEGYITINVDAVVKPLSYDFDQEIESYRIDQERKAVKAKGE